MPDVLEAPIVAKTFDDGYGPTSARSHFRLGGLSLSPWTWSLGSSMSGGVEVSARGGLRLATTHSPYVVEDGTTPASLLHHHHSQHLQHQRSSRYYPHLHPLSSQQNSGSQPASHHQRQHLSNLENLSHRRPPPLHLLHPRHAGKSAAAASGGRCVPLSADPTMRANERWVLLNKETFQEIFDATLHQMTYAPGELLNSGGTADDRKSTSSSSDRDAEDGGADSPPSPTTPEGLRCQRAAPMLCSRKRTLSDVAAEQEEAEAERSSFWRRASPLTAMAPTESAKTTTSALNDITNDRPGQRYSPAISGSAGSSTPPSPRLTSPGGVLTSPHSPQGTVAPPNPDRENNEPLDLSNKRSPAMETAGNSMNSDSDSNHAEWSPRPSPKCSSNNNNNNVAHLERAMSPTPASPTGDVAEGTGGGGPRQGSPGLAPPSSTTTTVTAPDRQTQPPPPRSLPAAAELRQKASPEGGPVRANGSYAPVDPRAPSPRGTEAGGGGSRGGVAAGGGRLGEEDARGGTPTTTTTQPALAGGGESSSSSSSQHVSVGGRGAGGGGGGSSSGTDSTATAPVSSVSTTQATSCSSSSITTTQTPTCNNTTIAATSSASRDTHQSATSQQAPPSHNRDTKSPNSVTPHTSTPKTLPDGGSGVSRMIADASGDPAATVATSSGKATTTSVTSRQGHTSSGQTMKHASENWMLLNKATVYDLVEEVMFSLGEDEEEKVSALRDSSNHRRTMSPAGLGSTPLQHQQQQSQQQSKSSRTASTTNNNNNAFKRTHAEMDGGHTGRRHRCSPPVPLERCLNQSQAQEERMERADDSNSSSRSAAGTQRPAVSTTKSQLRDHLSARSQQGKMPSSSSTSSRVSNHSDPTPRERLLQQQQQLTRCSPVRSTCLPPGDSSSTTSPTSKTKQQQCWVALNKNLVYNIVDSAMRNSETEEEDEEEELQKNVPSDPKSEVNGHGPGHSRERLGGAESDSNSNTSSEGESDNNTRRSNPNLKSTSDFDTQSQQVNGTKKRPCDNIPSCVTTGATLEEGEYVAKRNRVATPSSPVHTHPASPMRTSMTEGPSEGIAPPMGVSGARRTCLEGLLSESNGRRTPPAPARHQPHKPAAGEAPTSTSAAAAAGNDGGSKARRNVYLADCQPSRIDHAQSAASHPQRVDGNVAARSPPSTAPCGASSKNQSSSFHRGSSQVRGLMTATGRGAVSQVQAKGLMMSGRGDDVTSHTKHGLVTLPVSRHGLVPVSPSPSDARSSPRLGWVAVSKVDVHNIVDSVVDSMITGDPMSSLSSPPPPEVDTRSNPRSPVPSPPSSSMSPPHHMSSVTSPVPARDAESSHRASSPLCPSLTLGPRSPHQQEPEKRGRGTPSPVMASPGSPRSPCDVLDRCSDPKAATKAFKWKSSLLMRVEEEKIDVTPEVATTSGPAGSPRVGGKPASKSESRSLRSGKRGSRKGGSSSTSKLK